MKGARRT